MNQGAMHHIKIGVYKYSFNKSLMYVHVSSLLHYQIVFKADAHQEKKNQYAKHLECRAFKEANKQFKQYALVCCSNQIQKGGRRYTMPVIQMQSQWHSTFLFKKNNNTEIVKLKNKRQRIIEIYGVYGASSIFLDQSVLHG